MVGKEAALIKTGGELALLHGIRLRTGKPSRSGLTLGIGDDCALLRPGPNEEVAVTTDLSLDGRHFRLEWHQPEVIGHRTLARGLSDLAAMGARPIAAFLSLGLPEKLTYSGPVGKRSWIDRFYDGLLALADAYETPLAGGDLAQSPIALADIVLVGAVPRGRAMLRSGAKPGDVLYVTGQLGGAAAGLERLARLAEDSKDQPPKISAALSETLAPHLKPRPRLAQGSYLRRHSLATAALDISDGLSIDLAHICEESKVAAEIYTTALPLHPEATLAHALHGGEDYELLFTAHSSTEVPNEIDGVPVRPIGRILRPQPGKPQVFLQSEEGAQALEPKGWEHFSGDPHH